MAPKPTHRDEDALAVMVTPDQVKGGRASSFPPCALFPDLPPEVKEELASFVRTFDAAGFAEARHWYTTARKLGEAGIAVSPLALARRFGSASDIEVAYGCGADGPSFLRMTLTSRADQGTLVFRLVGPSAELFDVVAKLDLGQEPAVAFVPAARACRLPLLEVGSELRQVRLPPLEAGST